MPTTNTLLFSARARPSLLLLERRARGVQAREIDAGIDAANSHEQRAFALEEGRHVRGVALEVDDRLEVSGGGAVLAQLGERAQQRGRAAVDATLLEGTVEAGKQSGQPRTSGDKREDGEGERKDRGERGRRGSRGGCAPSPAPRRSSNQAYLRAGRRLDTAHATMVAASAPPPEGEPTWN